MEHTRNGQCRCTQRMGAASPSLPCPTPASANTPSPALTATVHLHHNLACHSPRPISAHNSLPRTPPYFCSCPTVCPCQRLCCISRLSLCCCLPAAKCFVPELQQPGLLPHLFLWVQNTGQHSSHQGQRAMAKVSSLVCCLICPYGAKGTGQGQNKGFSEVLNTYTYCTGSLLLRLINNYSTRANLKYAQTTRDLAGAKKKSNLKLA